MLAVDCCIVHLLHIVTHLLHQELRLWHTETTLPVSTKQKQESNKQKEKTATTKERKTKRFSESMISLNNDCQSRELKRKQIERE